MMTPVTDSPSRVSGQEQVWRMKDTDMDDNRAHFCTDNQCVSLHPRGLNPEPVTPAAPLYPCPRIQRHLQAILVFIVLMVVSCLVALSVVALQSRSPREDPFFQEPQVMFLGDNTTGPVEPNNDYYFGRSAELQEVIQIFKDHVENSSTWLVEIQMLKCRMDNVSSQVQLLGNHLGDASADIQMVKGTLKDASSLSLQTQALRSSLDMADAEIQRLKGDLEKANALTSQTQSFLKSSSENTSAELHMLSRGLENAKTEIQRLKTGLEMANGQAQLASSSLANANAEIHALRSHLDSVNDLRTQDQVLKSSLQEAQAEIQRLKGSLQDANALNSQTQTLLKGSLDNTRAEIQTLKGHLERAGNNTHLLKSDLETVTAQTQIANSRLEKTDAQIQVIKAKLENTNILNSQIGTLNGQMENASREIQTLKGGMEAIAALNSQIQILDSNLQKASAEMQRLKGDLETTTALTAKIQGEQSRLGTLYSTIASKEQLQRIQNQVQLILQGWKGYGGNLYYFSYVKKSWHEAERFCVSQGAHLASVTSQEEQVFLVQSTSTAYHWIGLTDRGSEGSWYWADGTPFNDAQSRGFWDRNQPDNWRHENGQTEDCVHVQQMWNDMDCGASYHWVCKQPMGQAEPKAGQS
ncbi:C-type lectin domain family 4 member F isoform X2 [Castor canadensis]|uniref:C-type lectin domain family 4 member F isoform X2 n=2 Tax=Castor canadensis TaxID=51338 RepID=A0AC58KM83_CASCN